VDSTNNCIETAVNVVASQGMQKFSPGQKTTTIGTELIITRIDACTGLLIFIGDGSAAVHSLRVAGQLRTATLTATVPYCGRGGHHASLHGEPHLAIGPAVRNQEHELFRDEDLGLFINSQLRGKLVPAVATGTVTGLGENWTPEPSTSAEILTQSAGVVTIERTP
jgi:hypothetical protein